MLENDRAKHLFTLPIAIDAFELRKIIRVKVSTIRV